MVFDQSFMFSGLDPGKRFEDGAAACRGVVHGGVDQHLNARLRTRRTD